MPRNVYIMIFKVINLLLLPNFHYRSRITFFFPEVILNIDIIGTQNFGTKDLLLLLLFRLFYWEVMAVNVHSSANPRMTSGKMHV